MSTALSLARIRRLLADGTARRIREQAGLSRAEIARDLGVDESAIYRWEAGRRVPRAAVAARYADLLAELLELELGKCSSP